MMRATALALLLLTGATAASAAEAPSANGTAFMQLYATSCADKTDYAAGKAAALAAGWVSAGKDADADLQGVLTQTKVVQKRFKALGSIMTFEAFTKEADGHRYGLVLTSTRGRPGQPGIFDCNLYDFSETAPIDPALVEGAFAVTDRAHQEDHGGTLDTWSLDGTPQNVTLGFIPRGSEAAGNMGYSAAWLAITTYAVMP
jgi:hypothetical protein